MCIWRFLATISLTTISLTMSLTISLSSIGRGQSPVGVTRSSHPASVSSHAAIASATVQSRHDPHGSFALQVLGGTLGSLAGVGIGLAITDDCTGQDDVVCALKSLSVAGALGMIGATAGVTIAGQAASERPSIIGGLVGAGVGTAIGVGLHHLITEELNQRLGDAGTLALFTISQGTFAAAGARVGTVLRSRG
jgi:hypothetical protein